MAERGKARSTIISDGSNTNIKQTPGTLYRINWTKPTDGTLRVENGELGATPELNPAMLSASDLTSTILLGLAATTDYDVPFGPGVGFDKLDIAATSNARVTVIYE